MRAAATLAAIACGLCASVAHAVPPESLFEITPRREGSEVTGLSSIYGNGLMYSADGGKTFTTLCSPLAAVSSVDPQGNPETQIPNGFKSAIITHDNHFMVAAFQGIYIDDGRGCNWQLVPELLNANVTALRFDPRDPKVVYGVTAINTDEGGANGLFKRDAEGRFERLGEQDSLAYRSLLVAPLSNEGVRFYVLAVSHQAVLMTHPDGTFTFLDQDAGLPVDDAGLPVEGAKLAPWYVIRYSDDFGDNWTTFDIGVAPGKAVRLAAVDPSNADRVVIVHLQDNDKPGWIAIPDKLFVSQDRGETFEPWVDVASLSGVTFKADGTVFIGDRGEGKKEDLRGLLRADSVLAEPEQIADYEVWCLEARGDELELCQRLEWGTADPDTGAFTKRFSYKEIETLHACGGDSVAICRAELCMSHCKHWPEAPLCIEHYPTCAMYYEPPPMPVPDAGPMSDASNVPMLDAGAPPASNSSDGCGCRAPGATRLPSRSSLLLALLAVLIGARRSRRAAS